MATTAKKSMFGVILTALIVVIIFGIIKMKTTDMPAPVIINTTGQPTLGNPDAKLHFVVFEDLKCVNCARFNNEIFPFIKRHYIDTGRAQYTMINLAFVPNSLPAATAARCVYTQSPVLFFPYVEYIFAHQPPEYENWATVPALLNFANQVPGINTDQLAKCILESPYDTFFQQNLKMAAHVIRPIVATPALYINGVQVTPPTRDRIMVIVNAQS